MVYVYEGFVNDVIIENSTKTSGRLFRTVKKYFLIKDKTGLVLNINGWGSDAIVALK